MKTSFKAALPWTPLISFTYPAIPTPETAGAMHFPLSRRSIPLMVEELASTTLEIVSPARTHLLLSTVPRMRQTLGFPRLRLSPGSVNAGGSATSTITVSNLNGYGGTVNLACSVAGNGAPLPTCSFTALTLTVNTTPGSSAMNHGASRIYYAMWLPVVGLSLIGMRFAAPGTRKKKLLGFLLLGLIMAALFFLPACGGSSNNGGGGGCTGCTPAGNYTVTVTGTDSVNTSLTHSVDLTLTVN